MDVASMTYTEIVALAVVATVILDLFVLRSRIILTRRYWIFMAVMTVLFFVVNGILTALPVVTYSSHAIIGLRLVTIPVEDIGYLFSLVTSTVAMYQRLQRRP
jgi:lycopene cyclase domain-containing protein